MSRINTFPLDNCEDKKGSYTLIHGYNDTIPKICQNKTDTSPNNDGKSVTMDSSLNKSDGM